MRLLLDTQVMLWARCACDRNRPVVPLVHHDPFDRLLIAQARVEGLTAVSSDGHWPGYDVSLHRFLRGKWP